MTTFRLVHTELRRLTSGKLPKLAILAIILVPLLYAGLYIYANWDPYGRLATVPAAVAIEDQGATRDDGSVLRAGEKVADRLAESDSFDWRRVDAMRARAGVASGQYSFAIVIPRDFSTALLSPNQADPRQARLRLITNDANNYLVGTMANQAAGEVRSAVAKDAGTEAADRMLLGFSTVHDKTLQAADGAGKLANGAGELDNGLTSATDGAHRLSDGAHQLVDGQRALVNGTDQLVDGTARLDDGAGQLRDGLDQLNQRTSALPVQTAALANGADQVAAGADQVAAGNAQLAEKAQQVGGLSQQLVDNADARKQRILDELRGRGVDEDTIGRISEVLNEADQPLTEANERLQAQIGGIQTLADGSRQVSDGAHRVADGNRQLANGTPAMADAIGQLDDGARQLADGTGELHAGANELRAGQQEALDGSTALANGAGELVGGAQRLSDGSDQLVDGAHTLADQLGRGARDIPALDDQSREDAAHTIGDPVAVDKRPQVSAQSYGAGIAPFFLGLALWIGSFVLFLLMRPLSKRALASGVPAWRIALAGWLPAALIGIVQSLVLYLVVVLGLGLRSAHPVLTLLFLALTSCAFSAVVHALNAAFGPRGKFVALVVLVLQLVTAGGTFPWQTIPPSLHPLHHMLPLSHVVTGLRHLLYGGSLAEVGTSAGVLACYLVAGLVLSTAAARRQQVWTPSRLKPELAL